MWDLISAGWGALQQGLFESLVEPLVFALGLGNRMEDAFNGTGWLLVGLLQLLVMLAVIAPLERWRPAEPVRDRAAIRVDIAYTLIHRLGLFRVALSFPGFDDQGQWAAFDELHQVVGLGGPGEHVVNGDDVFVCQVGGDASFFEEAFAGQFPVEHLLVQNFDGDGSFQAELSCFPDGAHAS